MVTKASLLLFAAVLSGCAQQQSPASTLPPLEYTDLVDQLQQYAHRVMRTEALAAVADDFAKSIASPVSQTTVFRDAMARTRRDLDTIASLDLWADRSGLSPRSVEAVRFLTAIHLLANEMDDDARAVLALPAVDSTEEMARELNLLSDAIDASHRRARLLTTLPAVSRVVNSGTVIYRGYLILRALGVDQSAAVAVVHHVATSPEAEVRKSSEQFDAITNAYFAIVAANSVESREPHIQVIAATVVPAGNAPDEAPSFLTT